MRQKEFLDKYDQKLPESDASPEEIEEIFARRGRAVVQQYLDEQK